MPTAEVEGIKSMLQAFGREHSMTYRWGPLNPDGTAVAIQLEGNGMQLTSVNEERLKEFYFGIRRLGDSPTYAEDARRLSDDLLAIPRRLPGVSTEWQIIPLNYDPGVPAAPSARPPGPPPADWAGGTALRTPYPGAAALSSASHPAAVSGKVLIPLATATWYTGWNRMM
jgi:hypothetical protein